MRRLLLAVLLLPLMACRPPIDGCTPRDNRCSHGELNPVSIPQTCSPETRWTATNQGVVCSSIGQVCRMATYNGRLRSACLPPLPPTTDGGAP